MTCEICQGNDYYVDDGERRNCPICHNTKEPPLERAVILETAKAMICGERARKHGDVHVNMQQCAEFWTTYKGVNFTSSDVCMMMLLLKASRQKMNPSEVDNYQDGAGYMALAWEVHQKEIGEV